MFVWTMEKTCNCANLSGLSELFPEYEYMNEYMNVWMNIWMSSYNAKKLERALYVHVLDAIKMGLIN